MSAIILAVLFLFACITGWLMLFPGTGEAVLRAAHSVASRTPLRRVHYWLLLGACLLVTAPPTVVWLAGGKVALPGSEERAINAHLESLLRGERLVAPPPLPPLAFTTAEIALVRPMLDSANRNWTLLDADFNRRLLAVFKIMREQHGYDMALLEGYRSPERQNQLADAGAHVTSARAFQSYHQFGLAADCAFFREGRIVISERDPWAMRGYRLYGETAESLGLRWGGRWAMMDFGHIELRKPREGH